MKFTTRVLYNTKLQSNPANYCQTLLHTCQGKYLARLLEQCPHSLTKWISTLCVQATRISQGFPMDCVQIARKKFEREEKEVTVP